MQETFGQAGIGARGLTPWCGWTPIRWAISDRLLRFRGRPTARTGAPTLLVWSALGLAVLVPIALIALVTGPYRPMMVNSETMAPTLTEGDVIVNEVVAPSDVRVGDLVSYSDAMRDGAVVTERVVEVRREGDLYAFATSTDASATVQQWTVDGQTELGRVAFIGPDLGRWFALPTGLAGALLLAGVALLFIWVALRPGRPAL